MIALVLLASLLAQAQAPRLLTLEEALRVAREHQPQLRQAHAGTEAARARADEARAPLLPQVNANVGYQRSTANAITRPGFAIGAGAPTHGAFDTFSFYSGSLTLNQLIWDFGLSLDRFRAARALADAQGETERAAALQAAVVVRAAYFDARAGKALAAVARETLQNLGRHLEQIQGFVEAGTRPQIDLAQARTDIANGRLQLITAENSFETARAQLNQAMGVFQSTDYDVADEAVPAVPGEDGAVEALLETALAARPEVQALQDQVRAQELTRRSVEGSYWPALGATAGTTQGGTALGNLGWNVAVGVSLNWNLFQGGLTRAQVHEAEANEGALLAQLDGLKLQVGFDVQQARLQVRAAKSSSAAVNDAQLNARERLRLAEGRYETGAGSSIELADAQIALSNAQAQAVQAEYRLATARAQLLRALGRP